MSTKPNSNLRGATHTYAKKPAQPKPHIKEFSSNTVSFDELARFSQRNNDPFIPPEVTIAKK
jgi:hypothetical protein